MIKKITNFENGENTYIISQNGEVLIIDPGSEYSDIISVAGENIKYIALTHCHFDHIEALRELKDKTNALVVFSKVGKSNLNDANTNLSKMVYGKNIGLEPDILVGDGDELKLGEVILKCIETPGHTSCGMSYLLDDNLFSGDTLFSGSIGRCDLPTGNYSVLEGSVKNKLYTLPDKTKVFPGHGEETTIGKEKKYNSFIRG